MSPPALHLVVTSGVLLVLVVAVAASSPGQHEHSSALLTATTINNHSLLSLTSSCGWPMGFPAFFNIHQVNHQTGSRGDLVFNTSQGCQFLTSIAPSSDPNTKRVFAAANVNNNPPVAPAALYVIDFADPNRGELKQIVPLPTLRSPSIIYLYFSLVFDQEANMVWFVTGQEDLSYRQPNLVLYLVKVDLNKGISYNVSTLPGPTTMVDQVARGVFNPQTRTYLIPLYQVLNSEGDLAYQLGHFDVDLGKFTNLVNTTWRTQSMFWYPRTATVYGFLSVAGRLNYARLDPVTGDWRILNQYHNHTYQEAFHLVLDDTAGLIYGVIDNWFTSVDVESGDIKSTIPLPAPKSAYVGLFGL